MSQRSTSLVAMSFALALWGAPPASAQAPAGCWVGTFATGPNATRGALEFGASGNGWTGSFHRLGANPGSEVLASVRLEGGSVTATFPSTPGTDGASFTGSVEGNALTGTILSGGQSLPVALTRVDPTTPEPALVLLGNWGGGLYQGAALILRLGLEVTPAPCGQARVTMESPDQGPDKIPASRVELVGDSVWIEIAAIAGSFRGVRTAGGEGIEGLWSQGGGVLPMRLGRGAGPISFARPQDPVPPLPYEEVEVAYENPSDGTRFGGTLTLPVGDGPFPAALLLTGSGAQDRDESIVGHRPFRLIADHLTRRGIAVLRVDDRGVGASTGDVMSATIADNVGDALAGVAFLEEDPRIDAARIGLIGHSEGGWVAPAAAAASDRIAYAVLLAGPAVTGRELLIAQARALVAATPGGAARVEPTVALNGIIYDLVLPEDDPSSAGAALQAGAAARIAALPESLRGEVQRLWEAPETQASLPSGLAAMTTPWFRYLFTFDPLPHLSALEIPVLALFGGRDLQVPPAQSVPILEAVWADHPDATIRVFPELNHLFQTARTGLPDEYALIEETFAPEALEAIGDWIEARFGGR